jgi:hypothetical protein
MRAVQLGDAVTVVELARATGVTEEQVSSLGDAESSTG